MRFVLPVLSSSLLSAPSSVGYRSQPPHFHPRNQILEGAFSEQSGGSKEWYGCSADGPHMVAGCLAVCDVCDLVVAAHIRSIFDSAAFDISLILPYSSDDVHVSLTCLVFRVSGLVCYRGDRTRDRRAVRRGLGH
eukprot:3932020-Rhodomonas_salina.3